ncbi:unnamed protein product [Protopolystoma xenopodis]|uniref:EGF-like domain-containing protein n=1 Tax=Protopolystoma xenopodis TaxID=117903 RepID=A0A448XNH1_9PLAT|nr:unnamed protein product [Protopolystoma xenopodis]
MNLLLICHFIRLTAFVHVATTPSRRYEIGCGECRGEPIPELAKCVNGTCICLPGYLLDESGKVCSECQSTADCHPEAKCTSNQEYQYSYGCKCKLGFIGDGVHSCTRSDILEPPPVTTTTSLPVSKEACGGRCRASNSKCDTVSQQCRCQRGYSGDGINYCDWNCELCLPNAECQRNEEKCVCRRGYQGDGYTYCDVITTPGKFLQMPFIKEYGF